MSPKEYIEKLKEQKAQAEKRFNNLSSLEGQLVDTAFTWLIENLDLANGAFVIPDNLPLLMDDFVLSIVSVTNHSTSYNKAFSNYLTDLQTLHDNTEKFHETFNRVIIKKPGIKDVQKTVVKEIINQYKGNGLNRHFAAPLRDAIFGNLLAGMNQKQAREYLRGYILSGKDKSGKLKSYLEQTAIQAVDSYTGAINMKIKQSFNFTGYIISGSLIATSSKQCKLAVEESKAGYLTFEEWKKILQIAKENKAAMLIEGTTIDNLPLNKLHWGCRHDFTPVIYN